jgi:hypothetical protein
MLSSALAVSFAASPLRKARAVEVELATNVVVNADKASFGYSLARWAVLLSFPL